MPSPQGDGSWEAANGAVYDLSSHDLRPDGWTSGDAAGLPILPGLIRYDEVAAGEIHHAIRFTVPETQSAHIWPARHDASSLTGSDYPPMGFAAAAAGRLRPLQLFAGNAGDFASIQNVWPHFG